MFGDSVGPKFFRLMFLNLETSAIPGSLSSGHGNPTTLSAEAHLNSTGQLTIDSTDNRWIVHKDG
jgi:hypothetical protein